MCFTSFHKGHPVNAAPALRALNCEWPYGSGWVVIPAADCLTGGPGSPATSQQGDAPASGGSAMSEAQLKAFVSQVRATERHAPCVDRGQLVIAVPAGNKHS